MAYDVATGMDIALAAPGDQLEILSATFPEIDVKFVDGTPLNTPATAAGTIGGEQMYRGKRRVLRTIDVKIKYDPVIVNNVQNAGYLGIVITFPDGATITGDGAAGAAALGKVSNVRFENEELMVADAMIQLTGTFVVAAAP